MKKLFKKIFSHTPAIDFSALINAGAIILDVRPVNGYACRHLRHSMNIPLDSLQYNLAKIEKNKPVITCCASGMRSNVARDILISKGYSQVYNAGSWMRLKKYDK